MFSFTMIALFLLILHSSRILPTMIVKAYAKINLGLHIVGKRTDGFHDIETIFHRIDLFDTLTLTENDSISVSVSTSDIPTEKENLCWKAAMLLQKQLQLSHGVHIHIEKHIPVGAGLGGGSSDAAAVLQSLPQFWHQQIEEKSLKSLALQIGSDVPFFLGKHSAYGEGRGERLTYVSLDVPYWIVVVYPNIHVSTSWAYQALSEKRNGTFPKRKTLGQKFSLSPLQSIVTAENDFEEVVFEAYPEIGEIKKKFFEARAVHALMSGSGSSVFGLFANESDARNAMKFFDRQYFVHLTEPHFTIA